MKQTICDFCGAAVRADDKDAMLYEVLLTAAEGFVLQSKQERDTVFAAEDVCPRCAHRIKLALLQIREAASSRSDNTTPEGVKPKSKPPKN